MPTLPPLHTLQVQSPLGDMLLAASATGLAGLWFIGQRHYPDTTRWQPATPGSATHGLLSEAAQQLCAYFDGQRQSFDLPFDLSYGTPFQQSVWQALLGIPLGHTASYGGLARAIGRPRAVRAVGLAVGRNPVSVMVPCHRVLGQDGSLTGYAGGLDRKRALLALEGIAQPAGTQQTQLLQTETAS